MSLRQFFTDSFKSAKRVFSGGGNLQIVGEKGITINGREVEDKKIFISGSVGSVEVSGGNSTIYILGDCLGKLEAVNVTIEGNVKKSVDCVNLRIGGRIDGNVDAVNIIKNRSN